MAGRWRAAACTALAVGLVASAPAARAHGPKTAPAPGGGTALQIVVVRPAGIRAYQEVTDEFAEACRVRARVVNLGEPLAFSAQTVVLAVGQHALEAVKATPARVVSALALHVPPGVLASDAVPPPELLLRAIKAARPSVARVVVVHGPRTAALIEKGIEPARALGMELRLARATDGPSAVRALRVASEGADAVWLAPDLDVVAPQVFQYALALQIRRGLLLAGASRQQVRSGALLAVDADPRAVGRQAAALVNELLSGAPLAQVAAEDRTGSLQLNVNGEAARRLGADLSALKALGAEVE